LVAAGIATFYDGWEIRAGDSIRQKIDAGLGDCTHFVVLLTPNSIQKPWVNAEIDAGFVRKLSGIAKFIPVRCGLPVAELSPLLAGLRSPTLDDYDNAVRELVADIHNVVQRPALGSLPSFAVQTLPQQAGLSTIAGQIAAHILRASQLGRSSDPQVSTDELRALLNVPDDDIAEAVDELESYGFVRSSRALNAGSIGFVRVLPSARIFAALDSWLMPWNPMDDAKAVAAELLNNAAGSFVVQLLAEQWGWAARRMNPAITLLVQSGAAEHSNSIDPTYEYYWLRKNIETRRFVRNN